MKLPREVKIRILPDGKVEVETHGFTGTSCTDLTKLLADILAGQNRDPGDVHEELKPEYYLQEQDMQQNVDQQE